MPSGVGLPTPFLRHSDNGLARLACRSPIVTITNDLGGAVSNEQRDRQQPQASVSREQTPQEGLVEKGFVAAISGVFSGVSRALVTHVLGDGTGPN